MLSAQYKSFKVAALAGLLTAGLLASGCGDDSVVTEPVQDSSGDAYLLADLGAIDTGKVDSGPADAGSTDGTGDSADQSDAANPGDAMPPDVPVDATPDEATPPNTAPTVVFVVPAEDVTVQAGQAVAMQLQATDDGGADQLLATAHYDLASAALWSGKPAANGQIAFTLPSLTAGKVKIVVQVADKSGLTASATRSFFVNTAPGAPAVAITPLLPTTLNALVAKVDQAASDPDRKPEDLQYSYAWFKDGQPTAELTETVVAGVAKKGEVWKVAVTAADPTAKGPAGQAQVVIQDAVASTPTVAVDPPAVDLQTEVSCAAGGAADPDGEAVTYTYQWLVNGLASSGATNQVWKLANVSLKVGDKLSCRATAVSAGVSGGQATSVQIAVAAFDVCNSAINPCSNKATCVNSDSLVPVCTCLPGYQGNGNACQDVDECAVDNGGCGAKAFWSCANNPGAAATCADLDECGVDNGGCGDPKLWSCKNNSGSAPTCADIDECLTNNGGCGDPKLWSCKNNSGSAPTCSDIDECLTNNGGCGDPNFYTCSNQAGAPVKCADIDECLTNNGGCGDPKYVICANKAGTKPECKDINECLSDAVPPNGGCGDPNFFACTNNQADQPTCSDIDECKGDAGLPNGGCGDPKFFQCLNQVGGVAKCEAILLCALANGGCGDPKYFNCSEQLGGLPECSDIDECKANNGGCGNAQYTLCSNQVGAAAKCSDIDECLDDNGGCGDAKFNTCTNNQGGLPSCADIDECQANSGPPNGGCGDPTYWACKNNLNASPTCTDIDDCKTSNGGCGDPSFVTCSNNIGKAASCTDIDECKANNGGCGDAKLWLCSNQQAQAPKCSDIDECLTNNGGCGDPKAWQCKNNAGGAASCSDIDECLTNNGGCGSGNICTNKVGGLQCSYPNCAAVKNASLPTGEYSVFLGAPRTVFCDNTTAGGGWMFVKPADIQALASFNFNSWRTDKGQVLIRLAGTYGQAYTAIQQLPSFATHPLSVTVGSSAVGSGSAGYNLKLVMIPTAVAAALTVQGFTSNGKELTFVNCDANPNSYFEFFTPTGGYDFAAAYALTSAWLGSKIAGGSVPASYFAKAAMHDGGCGAHNTSSYWATVDGTSAAALGMR